MQVLLTHQFRRPAASWISRLHLLAKDCVCHPIASSMMLDGVERRLACVRESIY